MEFAMGTQYNIYRIKKTLIDKLKEKIQTTELVEQKTIKTKNFTSTFYFSENIKGNDVWWWETYKPFMKKTTSNPANVFYYGLLISLPNDTNSKFAYLVSLGKSHFYLNEFIERDFGINLAIRMADEGSVLLKKSTYFSSIKKGDVSSYQKFIPDNYEPGESVDHLKLKANDRKLWGDKNLIFSDSVQLNDETKPNDIEFILTRIETAINGKELISLPKLEMVKREYDVKELDDIALTTIKRSPVEFTTSEFEILGNQILLAHENFNYELLTRIGNSTYENRTKIGNELDSSQIHDYVKKLPKHYTIDNIKVKFDTDTSGSKVKTLKEVLELSITHKGEDYFIRHGVWHKFNQTFMSYLKNSLEKIQTVKSHDLNEEHYKTWKEKKERLMLDCDTNNTPELLDNRITYREYHFNKLLSEKYGYELWDRDNKLLPSVNEGGRNYKVEIADLYLDGEVISLKISEDIGDLIYNIAQSTTAIELVKNKSINIGKELKTVSLWFVLDKKVDLITELNSIQLLIGIERWKQTVLNHGLTPKIILSRHLK